MKKTTTKNCWSVNLETNEMPQEGPDVIYTDDSILKTRQLYVVGTFCDKNEPVVMTFYEFECVNIDINQF